MNLVFLILKTTVFYGVDRDDDKRICCLFNSKASILSRAMNLRGYWRKELLLHGKPAEDEKAFR